MSTDTQRKLEQVVRGLDVSDGAGVNLKRIIGVPLLKEIDPFLLLDEFRSDDPDDYIGGFPAHPHRGFETVTYMKYGSFRHRDSHGHEGILRDGGVQYMTAGRGVIHSEMPEMKDGLLWGYQLWVNLPAALKMIEPAYQDIPATGIPIVEGEGRRVVVIAGEVDGQGGAMQTLHPITYLDVELEKGARFQFAPSPTANSFLHVHSGTIVAPFDDGGRDTLRSGEGALCVRGDDVAVQAAEGSAGFLFLSSEPLNEPIERGGPFVMNTREELEQAFRDYQDGRLVR